MLVFKSTEPLEGGFSSITVEFDGQLLEVLLPENVAKQKFDDIRAEILSITSKHDWDYFYQEIRRMGIVDSIASKVSSKSAFQFAFNRLETALTVTHQLRDAYRYWQELLPVVATVLTDEQRAEIALAATRSNLAQLLDPSRPPYDPVIDGSLADYEAKYPSPPVTTDADTDS